MFKEIFDSSPIAQILVSKDSKIELVNRFAEKLFGYADAELVGQDLAVLIPQDVRERHPSLVKSYFTSPLPRLMGQGRNLFGIKKDETKFPIEVGLTPIRANGKLLVMSSIIDITERVRAEERFRAAVDAAPSGMIMINEKGIINLTNKKVEEIFGYEKSELLNKPIETLVPQDFRGPHPKFVESYVRKPEPRAMGIGRELFGRHKSGRLVPVEIGLQPVYFENETFVISSIVDITQRKVAEREIQDKTEEIREFSYRTSHDLKTPLLSISGLTDCIIEDLAKNDFETAKANLRKTKSLSKKLNQLIEDILALTKVDLSKEEQTAFDFATYFEDMVEKFSHFLNQTEVKLERVLSHNKELITQKTRLTQVLDNLISNAIKYNDKNEKSVRLDTFNDSDKFYIRLEDNGMGIPKSRYGDVFSMFKRFHKDKADGSGLGLYMVKKHIEKLGAQIKFESSPEGTTFYIEFSLRPN